MTIQLNGKTPTKIVRWHNGAEQAVKKIVIFPDGVTEKQIRPAGWQPGPNTILYFPLKSDAVDVIHSVSMTTQGSVQWTTPSGAKVPCAYFSSPGYFSKTTSTSYLVTGNGARTISGWIMLTGNCRTSVACYGTGSSNQMFTLYYNDGNSNWRFTQWGSGSSYGSTMSMNTWYNVVITYDGSTVKWYINSNLDVSWSRSLSTSNAKMFLAGDMSETGSATPNTGLQGYLSEVIFEDKARTAQEVADYYNLTKWNYGL